MSKSATWVCPSCNQELPVSEVMTHTVNVCRGSKAKMGRYLVAARDKRTHNGICYASALEMKRAQELDVLREAAYVVEWFRQIRKPIGCEEIVSDFIVTGNYRNVHGDGYTSPASTWIEEIKGHVTADWARHLRWWKASGRLPLVILTASRDGGWSRVVVTP